MSNKRRPRRHDRERDDNIHIKYDPATLCWGVGSGSIRERLGEDAERVCAGLLLEQFLRGPLGATDPDMNIDRLILALRELVEAGALTEDGPSLTWLN